MRKTKPTKQKFPHKQQQAANSKPVLEAIENLIPFLEDSEAAYHAVRLTENTITEQSLALVAMFQHNASQIAINEQIRLIIQSKDNLATQNEKLKNKTAVLNKRSEEIGVNPLDLRGYRQLLSREQNADTKETLSANEPQFKSNLPSQSGTHIEIGISCSFTESDFWDAFVEDLKAAQKSVFIVSPYMYRARTSLLINTFKTLANRGIWIHVVTKPTNEYESTKEEETQKLLGILKNAGLKVSLYSDCHQKIAIIDKTIVWEGSLNILSHKTDKSTTTKEHMRRLESYELAKDLYENLRLEQNARPF